MARERPDDAELGWEAFETWADENGVPENTDDWSAWWECWTRGYEVGYEKGMIDA